MALPVGEIHAFGDDSITDDIIVCAAAIFPAERVVAAETVLADVKRRVGLSSEAAIHCRVIFAGDARRGTEWEVVSPEAIFEMARTICETLHPIGLRPHVAVVDPSHIPPLPVAPGQPHRPPDDKAVASLAYSAVSNGIVRAYAPNIVRLWIDPDSTRIPWGPGRRRADRTRSMFVDIGPGQEPLHVEPQVVDSPKPRLLEVADLYAYVTAQAHSQKGGQRSERFRDLYRIVAPERWMFEFSSSSEWHSA